MRLRKCALIVMALAAASCDAPRVDDAGYVTTEGRWLGDVEAPDRVYLVDAAGDVVLGIWRDEFDVPHVQLHRFGSESTGG